MTLQHPNGRAYPLEIDADTDANGQTVGHYTWSQDVPDCPACQTPLDDDGSLSKRASVEPRYMAPEVVVCQGCGYKQEVSA